MSSQYNHRNGEMELPTVPGVYWFSGQLDDLERRGMVDVAELVGHPGTASGIAWPLWGMHGWVDLSGFVGRWWGPITPPWRE